MPFTLKIQSKTLFGNKKVDFKQLLINCGLRFGHDNEFYIIENGMVDNTAILYNPKRIGRGIFFDGREMQEGKVLISYNIPTTETEINDFINVVIELKKQLKKISIVCEETKQEYTLNQLIDSKEEMVRFSLEKLNEFCSNKEYTSNVLTLAYWPFVLPDENVKKFASCTDLKEFEQLIHSKQDIDVYYAKPTFYKNRDGNIIANYVLTEECESIFPIKSDGYFATNKIEIDEGLVCFYILSEDRMIDGAYNYDKFIEYIMHKKCQYFDKSHIIVPSMSKEELVEMAKALQDAV